VVLSLSFILPWPQLTILAISRRPQPEFHKASNAIAQSAFQSRSGAQLFSGRVGATQLKIPRL
jgi:hypothetical protein